MSTQPLPRLSDQDAEAAPTTRTRRKRRLLILVIAVGIFWLLLGRNPLDDSPPNWGYPPLYPGARIVATRTWAPGESNGLYVRDRWPMGLNCAVIKQISIAAPAPADVVLAWYQARFTGEGWAYDAKPFNVGDIMPRYITTGFWHYNWYWYDKSIFSGPSHFMDIQAGQTIDILLGQSDQCWKPWDTSTPQ